MTAVSGCVVGLNTEDAAHMMVEMSSPTGSGVVEEVEPEIQMCQ